MDAVISMHGEGTWLTNQTLDDYNSRDYHSKHLSVWYNITKTFMSLFYNSSSEEEL